MIVIVTTQEELDAAIKSGAEDIVIDSPPTVWLELRGSSCVQARGYSRVVAWGYSRVEAWGYSHVVAWELSHVEAWDSSHVEARGHSRVEAWDWTRVDALEWPIVYAWGDSSVSASPRVTVYVHCARATVTGGTIIDAANIDLSDPAVWVAYHGVTTKDGAAIVYKAASRELVDGQDRILTAYAIGSTVEATDWDPTPRCGHGLHFSPAPSQARLYYQGDGEPRYLACEVDITSLVPLDDECKAPRCKVLYEVDRFGDPVAGAGIDDEQETTP